MEMPDEVRQLLERSVQAYRRGRFMRLFGEHYQQHVDSHSDAEVVEEILGKFKYRDPIQVAFEDNSPRPDEIYLYAIRRSAVVTNQRLFLLDKNGLMHPPINLADIRNYKGSGLLSSDEQIELSTGETIKRRASGSVDEKTMRKLIDASSDPKAALSLHIPVSKTALARRKRATLDRARARTAPTKSSGTKNKPQEPEESFGSIVGEFWPAFVGFCAFVVVLLANGAPIFEGGPTLIRWLSREGNMFFFYFGVVAGVIAAVFAARGELIPNPFKASSRNDRADD